MHHQPDQNNKNISDTAVFVSHYWQVFVSRVDRVRCCLLCRVIILCHKFRSIYVGRR